MSRFWTIVCLSLQPGSNLYASFIATEHLIATPFSPFSCSYRTVHVEQMLCATQQGLNPVLSKRVFSGGLPKIKHIDINKNKLRSSPTPVFDR